MKRHTKQLLFAAVTVVFVFISCRTHYPLVAKSYVVIKRDNSLERGKNLTFNVCAQCHLNIETRKFTGKQMKDLPGFMGRAYSANLTNDPTYGVLKNYTDAQLFYLVKTGIKHDGKFIPYMVRPTIADDDLNDIIVYLRSGDEPLQADGKNGGITKLSAIGKMAISFSGKPTPYKTGIKAPDDNYPVTYGRYLVDEIGCFHCHSKSILGLNYENAEKSKGYMAGGMKWKIDGKKIYSANLTPDKQTGIGKYTKEEFRKAVREKIGKNGRPLRAPMPKYPRLEDKQVDAIYAYLMQLLPKEHHIKGHVDY